MHIASRRAKVASLVVALALAAGLLACGGNGGDTGQPTPPATPTPPPPAPPPAPSTADPAIAYQDGPNIAVVDEDGSNARTLTSDGLNRTPSWSPDGAWLVFARREQVQGRTVQGIYIMRKDGSSRCRVVDVTATDDALFLHPAWSPQPVGGKHWIVYFDVPAGGQFHNLFAAEAPADPSAGCTTKPSGTLLTPGTESDAETRPSWSPSADNIVAQVFTPSGIEIVTYAFAVVNESPQLNDRRVVTTSGGLAGVPQPVFPKWANTRERLFVQANPTGIVGDTDTWWADLSGNANFNITSGLGSGHEQLEATPSPDDRQITFLGSTSIDSTFGIHKVNVDGTGPQLLVGGTGLKHPNWRRCNRSSADQIPDCR